MKKISWIALLAVTSGLAVQAALITQSFTSDEGFTNGALNGQQGWVANGDNWIVDTAGDGSAVRTANFGNSAVNINSFTLAAQGTSEVFRTEFHILGTPVTPSAATTLITVGFSSVGAYDAANGDINNTTLQLVTTGNMQMRADNSSGTLDPNIASSIAGNGSDLFAIEYYIVLGTTAATSEFWAQLINLTDDTVSGFSKYDGLESSVFAAATTTGLFPAFSVGAMTNNGSGVTGISVDSTTVIPEPATLGLLGFSSLALFLVRHWIRK